MNNTLKKYIAINSRGTITEVIGFKEAINTAIPGDILSLRVYKLNNLGLCNMNDMKEAIIGTAPGLTMDDYYKAYDSIV